MIHGILFGNVDGERLLKNWSLIRNEERTPSGAETIGLKSCFLLFRRMKLLLLSATRINLAKARRGEKRDSPGSLRTLSPVKNMPWLTRLCVFRLCQSNLKLQNKLKSKTNKQQCKSLRVRSAEMLGLSSPKAFRIFTALLPEWVSTDL